LIAELVPEIFTIRMPRPAHRSDDPELHVGHVVGTRREEEEGLGAVGGGPHCFKAADVRFADLRRRQKSSGSPPVACKAL
jgi:hypothetical protein